MSSKIPVLFAAIAVLAIGVLPATAQQTQMKYDKNGRVYYGPGGPNRVVQQGNTVQTDYLLVTWSDKKVVDTSFGRGPFAVQDVGHAQVIDGWNQGLIGMKQGGRRLLIVPPDLGYGQGGNGIQPNETLVFVIDAVTVTP